MMMLMIMAMMMMMMMIIHLHLGSSKAMESDSHPSLLCRDDIGSPSGNMVGGLPLVAHTGEDSIGPAPHQ